MSLKQFFKRNGRRIAVLTCAIYLFHIVAPVYYAKLQAELYMRVSGKVVDKETGERVPSAFVAVTQIENGISKVVQGITTNKDGKYLLEMLPPGQYQLLAFPPKERNYALDVTLQRQITVVRGKNLTNIDFQLEAGGRISGKVNGADGNVAIPGTTVIAMPTDNVGFGQAITDNFGNYEIKHLKQGNYVLVVIPDGYTSTVRKISVSASPIPQLLNIDLSPNKTTCISGLVKSSATNDPIPNAMVTIVKEEKGGISSTNTEGKYKLCGLEGGNYKIAVGAEGFEIKQESDIQILNEQETIRDFNLLSQNPQGLRRPRENKTVFGLNTKKLPLGGLGSSYAYAQGNTNWCGIDTNCMGDCLDRKGVGTAWNFITNAISCVVPDSLSAAIVLTLCGLSLFPPTIVGRVIIVLGFFLLEFLAAVILTIAILAICLDSFIKMVSCPFEEIIDCYDECRPKIAQKFFRITKTFHNVIRRLRHEF